MQSRYYDPTIGRFLNADALVSTGQGVLGNNMFAYCGNNPASRTDPSGRAYVQIDYNFEGSVDRMLFVLGGGSGGGCAYALCAAGSGPRAIRKLDRIVNNESETVVQANLDKYGIAFYKGVLVFAVDWMGSSALSLGIILIGSENLKRSDFSDTLNHEYGHYVHMEQIGVVTYVATAAVPSLIGAGFSYFVPFVNKNYMSQPWEWIANQLGGVNDTYLPGANTAGTAFYLYTLMISDIITLVISDIIP